MSLTAYNLISSHPHDTATYGMARPGFASRCTAWQREAGQGKDIVNVMNMINVINIIFVIDQDSRLAQARRGEAWLCVVRLCKARDHDNCCLLALDLGLVGFCNARYGWAVLGKVRIQLHDHQARLSPARLRNAMCGQAWSSDAMLGKEIDNGLAMYGEAQYGLALRCKARLGTVKIFNTSDRGTVRLGVALCCTARVNSYYRKGPISLIRKSAIIVFNNNALRGLVRPGFVARGTAEYGTAWFGAARQGTFAVTRSGMVVQGASLPGPARQGSFFALVAVQGMAKPVNVWRGETWHGAARHGSSLINSLMQSLTRSGGTARYGGAWSAEVLRCKVWRGKARFISRSRFCEVWYCLVRQCPARLGEARLGYILITAFTMRFGMAAQCSALRCASMRGTARRGLSRQLSVLIAGLGGVRSGRSFHGTAGRGKEVLD